MMPEVRIDPHPPDKSPKVLETSSLSPDLGTNPKLRGTLFRVEFDDQLLVDRQVNVLALRQGEDFAGEIVAVDVEPLDLVLTGGEVLCRFQLGQRLRAFAD